MAGDALAFEERFSSLEVALARRGNGARAVRDENRDDDRQRQHDEADRKS